jgi:hypothetical protein
VIQLNLGKRLVLEFLAILENRLYPEDPENRLYLEHPENPFYLEDLVNLEIQLYLEDLVDLGIPVIRFPPAIHVFHHNQRDLWNQEHQLNLEDLEFLVSLENH